MKTGGNRARRESVFGSEVSRGRGFSIRVSAVRFCPLLLNYMLRKPVRAPPTWKIHVQSGPRHFQTLPAHPPTARRHLQNHSTHVQTSLAHLPTAPRDLPTGAPHVPTSITHLLTCEIRLPRHLLRGFP